MEPDGKTRLYYYSERPYKVKEAWPQPAGWTEEAYTTGAEAEEIYNRAEFICVSVSVPDRKTNKLTEYYWSVHPKGKDCKHWFKVNRMGLRDEQDYPNLAKKLEKRAHKKGLTILIT